MTTILAHFPLPQIREKQKNVLYEIESAIKSGYRQVFIEAPTGFGKTPAAIAIARYLGSSHICTATKDLQTQYRRDFQFVAEVKGRGNFPCVVKEDMGLDESCDYDPCVKDDYATTYILDSSISYLLKSAQDLVPKWFSEVIVQP